MVQVGKLFGKKLSDSVYMPVTLQVHRETLKNKLSYSSLKFYVWQAFSKAPAMASQKIEEKESLCSHWEKQNNRVF